MIKELKDLIGQPIRCEIDGDAYEGVITLVTTDKNNRVYLEAEMSMLGNGGEVVFEDDYVSRYLTSEEINNPSIIDVDKISWWN